MNSNYDKWYIDTIKQYKLLIKQREKKQTIFHVVNDFTDKVPIRTFVIDKKQ